MKYLYLRYLNLRLWFLRRRLNLHRRLQRMGFTGGNVNRRRWNHPVDSKELLDYIKIGIGVIAIASMWLIFFLHQNGTAEARPQEQPSLVAPFMPLKSQIFSF